MPNGRCRMHGGMSPGAPKGNKNALKHGRYTNEAIAERRKISELMKAIKAFGSIKEMPAAGPLRGRMLHGGVAATLTTMIGTGDSRIALHGVDPDFFWHRPNDGGQR